MQWVKPFRDKISGLVKTTKCREKTKRFRTRPSERFSFYDVLNHILQYFETPCSM